MSALMLSHRSTLYSPFHEIFMYATVISSFIKQLRLTNLQSKTRNTPQRRHKKKIQGLAWVIGVVGGAGCSPNMGALGEHQMGQGSRRRWISVESHLDQYPSHQNGRWRWNLSTLGFRCHFWILMRPIRDIRGKQIFVTIKQLRTHWIHTDTASI